MHKHSKLSSVYPDHANICHVRAFCWFLSKGRIWDSKWFAPEGVAAGRTEGGGSPMHKHDVSNHHTSIYPQ